MLSRLRIKRIGTSGFTLIEVIVVAVIIAVLSAVAIPLYNGYIRDSRRNTAENVAGSAASFVGTYFSMNGNLDGITVSGSTTGSLTDNLGDWIYSVDGTKSEFVSSTSTDENRFVIPTDIQIRVTSDGTDHVVEGAHVKSVIEHGSPTSAGGEPATEDITQPYHFH
jgi:prepilin-type N-terminal cleavage/methylation domain-containing protein